MFRETGTQAHSVLALGGSSVPTRSSKPHTRQTPSAGRVLSHPASQGPAPAPAASCSSWGDRHAYTTTAASIEYPHEPDSTKPPSLPALPVLIALGCCCAAERKATPALPLLTGCCRAPIASRHSLSRAAMHGSARTPRCAQATGRLRRQLLVLVLHRPCAPPPAAAAAGGRRQQLTPPPPTLPPSSLAPAHLPLATAWVPG
jgi:hypothetical protein